MLCREGQFELKDMLQNRNHASEASSSTITERDGDSMAERSSLASTIRTTEFSFDHEIINTAAYRRVLHSMTRKKPLKQARVKATMPITVNLIDLEEEP